MRNPLFSLGLALAFLASPAWAANKTWIGAAAGLWSNAANWQGGVAPVNGDRLVFPAGSGSPSTNDLVGAVLDGIDVGDTAFLNGNALTLTSATPITVQTRLSVSQAIRFAAPGPTITVGHELDFSGALTFTGGTVHIEGPNAQLSIFGPILEDSPTSLVFDVLETSLSSASSFTGTLTINSGDVATVSNGALGSSSSGTTVSAYGFYVQGYQGQTFAEPLTFNSLRYFGFDAAAISSPIVIAGSTNFLAQSPGTRFTGPISGSGRMVVPGASFPITLAANNTFTGGLEIGGDVRADRNDAFPAASELIVDLYGRVDVGAYTQRVRSLTCAGTLALTVPGYLVVDEGARISGCALEIAFPPGYVAADEILIIDNQSSTATGGEFSALFEGSPVVVNGATLYITYRAGNGSNDVLLRRASAPPPPPPPASPTAPSVQDMWWSPQESGWGMSIVQHGDKLFTVIYAYDALGKPTWYVMPNGAWSSTDFTRYAGDVYSPRGSAFYQYDATGFVPGNGVGNLSIIFDSATNPVNATLEFTIGGVSGRKLATRQPFGRGTGANVGAHGDMWWGGANQNGWGIAILQQGDTLFNVWFTYDAAGLPTWFVMPGGTWTASDTYDGSIYRTLGTPWMSYDASRLQVFDSGPYRLRFNGDSATLDYSVDGRSGRLLLDKQPF